MKWTEIYDKYKDTELMKDFYECRYAKWRKHLLGIDCYKNHPEGKKEVEKLVVGTMEFQTIKDIWGYLICFAEMKGYLIEVGKFVGSISKWHNEPEKQYFQHEDFEEGFSGIEQAMLWCANKFFEIGV